MDVLGRTRYSSSCRYQARSWWLTRHGKAGMSVSMVPEKSCVSSLVASTVPIASRPIHDRIDEHVDGIVNAKMALYLRALANLSASTGNLEEKQQSRAQRLSARVLLFLKLLPPTATLTSILSPLLISLHMQSHHDPATRTSRLALLPPPRTRTIHHHLGPSWCPSKGP